MRSAWLSGFAFLLISTLVGAGILVVARLLRVQPRAENPLKKRTYECGEAPDGAAWMQFHARYYVVALFFVLFDIETAFLLPWATIVKEAGATGLVAVGSFVVVLMLGWVWASRKGALQWQ